LDIAYLARELPRVHAGGNGLIHVSEQRFQAEAAALESRSPTLNSAQLLVGIMRLLALLHDGETGLTLPSDNQFPISTRWFGDELRLTGVPQSEASMLGARILAIDGKPISVVHRALLEVIPANTSWEAGALFGSYLRFGRILYGLGITSSVSKATLTVEEQGGRVRRVAINTEMALPDGQDPQGIIGPKPTLADEQRDSPYWWRYLTRTNVVYLKYNRCVSGSGFSAVARDAVAAMRAHPDSRLVVDLRHNGGGDSRPFDALLSALRRDPALQAPGRIYGVIDRGTFSSATLDAVQLRTETRAQLIGEPTGDPANQWGEQRWLFLTDYLPVHYSTHYFDPAPRYHGKPYVAPDIPVETSLTDLLDGVDAVMSTILSRPVGSMSSSNGLQGPGIGY
jgi:hypothetical protein